MPDMENDRPNLLNLDRAAVYAVAFRSLAIVTGPVTVLIIAARFTPELQGYFYTITAILAMQVLLEMGLGTALQQIASHEWARLKLNEGGSIEGDANALNRLATVARFALRWFSAAGILAAVGFGVSGYLFFAAAPDSETIAWDGPWLILSVLAGLNLFTSPGWTILEGCNQVRRVYGFRLVQGLLTRLVLWIGILSGAGLYALVMERALNFLLSAVFFLVKYPRFFADLFRVKDIQQRFWKEEIWPLQWRFALVWISGYIPSLFIPVIFALQGPVEAGRFGMTWTIASALMAVSHAVLAPRMPRFAMAIAKKKYDALDALFSQSMRTCVIVLLSGSLIFLGAVYILEYFESKLAERFLPLLPTAVLLVAVFMQQIRHAMGIYLRAHKKEPFLMLSIVEALLMIGILYPLGKWSGATGLALGFMVVATLILVPGYAIFRRCKIDWHADIEVD
jgi:O-antigen/teichoic acid export membrane protein